MPLGMAATGVETKIQRINGKDEVRRFLEGLGFVEGSTVTVISKINGNLIVNMRDSRIALDKRLANRIFVG